MVIIAEALRFVRQRRDELFPDGKVDGSVLLSNIAFGAAALGSGHVEIKREGDWCFAASEFNWMEPHPPQFTEVRELFARYVDFPELGPTSSRPEIYVAAFATRVYVDLAGSIECLIGTHVPNPLPHLGVVPVWCPYVLAFQLNLCS